MPISEPYLPKGNAPQSLAFEEPAGSQASYQTTISVREEVTRTVEELDDFGYADRAYVDSRIAAVMSAITAAELRAKTHVNDWHNAFQWAMDDTVEPQNILFNVWYPLQFPLCIVQGDVAANSGGYWEFQATRETEGSYFIGAEIELKHQNAAVVESTEAAIMVDGVWYANLPWTDQRDTESNVMSPSHSHVRYGATLMPCIRGKRISVWVRISSSQTDDDYYTGSIGGHVHGFRVSCNGDRTYRNLSDLNTATPSNSYTQP